MLRSTSRGDDEGCPCSKHGQGMPYTIVTAQEYWLVWIIDVIARWSLYRPAKDGTGVSATINAWIEAVARRGS